MGAGQVVTLLLTLSAVGDAMGQQGQMAISGEGERALFALLLCSLEVFSDSNIIFIYLFFCHSGELDAHRHPTSSEPGVKTAKQNKGLSF